MDARAPTRSQTQPNTPTNMFAGYFNVCKQLEWWRKLKAVHKLLEPFKTAIHVLEADKALLSQVITDLLVYLRCNISAHAIQLGKITPIVVSNEFVPPFLDRSTPLSMLSKPTQLHGLPMRT